MCVNISSLFKRFFIIGLSSYFVLLGSLDSRCTRGRKKVKVGRKKTNKKFSEDKGGKIAEFMN